MSVGQAKKHQALLDEIQQKQFHAVYWLEGDEPFFINKLAEKLRASVLGEDERAFNEWIMHGHEASLEGVLKQAAQPSIGSNRKLIIVREAQKLDGWRQEGALQRLVNYLKQPAVFTVLVFCLHIERRGSFLNKKSVRDAIKQHASVVESKKLYENELPNWAMKRAQAAGHELSAKAASLLCEHTGNDLFSLSHELEKVLSLQQDGAPIGAKEIAEQVGISREFNIFELQRAVGGRECNRGMLIADYMAQARRGVGMQVLGGLFQYFLKLLSYEVGLKKGLRGEALARFVGVHVYFLREYQAAYRNQQGDSLCRALHLIHEADLKLKGMYGGITSERELIKELVYSLTTKTP